MPNLPYNAADRQSLHQKAGTAQLLELGRQLVSLWNGGISSWGKERDEKPVIEAEDRLIEFLKRNPTSKLAKMLRVPPIKGAELPDRRVVRVVAAMAGLHFYMDHASLPAMRVARVCCLAGGTDLLLEYRRLLGVLALNERIAVVADAGALAKVRLRDELLNLILGGRECVAQLHEGLFQEIREERRKRCSLNSKGRKKAKPPAPVHGIPSARA